MNVSKYMPSVGISDAGIGTKGFKSPTIIENDKTSRINERARGIITGSNDSSNRIETNSEDVQLLNFLNCEKWCRSKNVYMAYVNDYDYDADIDEDDNMCDIDEDDMCDTDIDFDIEEQCISPSPYSLAQSPNSSWLNNEAGNDGLSDSSFWDSEWIKHFIRNDNQKVRRKQRKVHNCSVPRYKNSCMYDWQFEEEESSTQVLFDTSPDKIIPDIEKASEFERFVLLELPNIPSDYEPSFDEEENHKLWEAAIEEEKVKCFHQAISNNKNLKVKSTNAKVADLKTAKKMKKSMYIHRTTQKQFPKYFRRKKCIIKLVKKLNKKKRPLNIKHIYEGRGLRYIKKSTSSVFQKIGLKGKK